MIGTYKTPAAYRQALEQRVRATANQSGLDMSRHRQVLIYDRFLVRAFAEFGNAAILKGGVVLELRLERPHDTRCRSSLDGKPRERACATSTSRTKGSR
jgi:hypothetical protein